MRNAQDGRLRSLIDELYARTARTLAGLVETITGVSPIVVTPGQNPVVSISPATVTTAGSLSAADKAKLNATQPSGWTPVAAGGSAVITGGIGYKGAFDTTGAQDQAPLPAGATDGQVVILKAVGASNTNGIRIVPGAGQSIEDPGNPGVVLAANASATAFGQGVSLTYCFQLLGARWLIQANA